MPCGPNPETRFPIPGVGRTGFLKSVVANPAIIVGDYTYYDDPDDPAGFKRNVLYHFGFENDRLIIGRFCQIAAGVRFVMNGANHRLTGFSTYPFAVFGQGWSHRFEGELDFPSRGDTRIGNDVWLGYDAPTIERLLAVRWWDWDVDKVTRNIAAICGADISALEEAE